MEKDELKVMRKADGYYPELLKGIPDAPQQLFCLGDATILSGAAMFVAIVGTRRATDYGLHMAHQIAAELAAAGCVIVSGLAYGIDAAAHEGALDGGGTTIAVLGSGHEHVERHTNKLLAQEIRKRGCIISEYQPAMAPHRGTFPQRNRIIAGLSHATVVIEAPHASGALITARHAIDYGREICAVPGSVMHENNSGTHALIQKGEAALVTSARDIIALLELNPSIEKASATPLSSLSEYERTVLEALTTKTTSLEQLHQHVSLHQSKLQSTLSHLELKQLITIRGDQIFVTR